LKVNISIILPACNSDKYIKKTILSILNQSYRNFELIIIIDPSTDNTITEIKKFKDRRIVLIINKHKLGLPSCLNLGIKKAKSEIIARADSDDYYLKNRLKDQYNFLSNNKNIDLVGSNAFILDNKKITKLILPTTRSLIKWYMLFRCPFLHPSIMIRKKIFYKYGFYPPVKYEDYQLYSKIIDKIKYTNLKNILCVIRKHPDNISNHKNKSDMLDEVTIYKNHIKKYYKLNITNPVLSVLHSLNVPRSKEYVYLAIKKIKELRTKFFKKNLLTKEEINAIDTEIVIKIILICIKHQAYKDLLLNIFYMIKMNKFFLYFLLKKIICRFFFKKNISFINY